MFCFFWRQKEVTELLSRLWKTLGKGVFFKFWPTSRRARTVRLWWEARKETHFKVDVSALWLIAETLKLLTWSGAPFLGLLCHRLKDSLWRTVKSVCCVYVSAIWGKKKKNVAVAEPSVTFDVIEICLPLCHFFSFTTNVCPYIFDWKCQLDTFATKLPPCQLFTHCILNFWYIVTTYS